MVGYCKHLRWWYIDFSIKEYIPIESVQVDIWALMALPSRGAVLHEMVHRGLSFVFYKQLAVILDISKSELRHYLFMSSATLTRRSMAGRLSVAEGDRLCTLISVLNAAHELFEGDLRAAREWMKSPAFGLDSRAPLDMLGTRVEAQAVIDLIGRLENGTHA
ncbi:antitoxin Xre/MbcA/ParS toxin-binding domain-containing protein [Pseudomonas citri]|uniref:antitoxin Xre/MbcA/ParS toxin-binding domain-containing protein n=1 Tax=Pseudomonas citri TaxID=2978349 RepID=UPI0021B5D632|nr:antitoxin Xre/MbcA/ParS toxin-binding domain-containing protein [Pseudomonas citri]